MTATLPCAHCRTPVEMDSVSCPGCHSPIEVMTFPALLAQPQISVAAPAMEGEAGCFYHPSNKAVAACDLCGRFLCVLCQIDFLDECWCPNCIQISRQKRRLSGLDAVRPLYGNAAIGLATVPLLFWPITLMTAPMALYVTIRYWSAPSSLVRSNRWQFYVAILFSVVELGGWFWLVGLVVSRL